MEKSNIANWVRKGEIGILSISNGKENYLNTPDFLNPDALKKWTSEDNLKGIIITGAGRNFSAGADMKNLKALVEDEIILNEKMNEGKAILDFIEDLDIPVISAINGICFGGGLEIALASHMRICSPKALFAFPEINHGIIPGLGGTYRLTQLIKKGTYEILLNGDMMNAGKAKEIGLTDYISESKDSMELAMDKLENMIKDRSIEVIRSAMKAIKNSKILDKNEALKSETELFCKLAVNVKPLQ